jgi:uroporphyrinogen-III decarboxylase
MERREIVARAIEFRSPPRLPFFQHEVAAAPDDVCDCWEMDRAERGWFFDHAVEDDWGCGWAVTEQKNMGQVVHHPLADWNRLDAYLPPDPRNPYYFARLEETLSQARDRYVVVTAHFNLIERLHMLHGFRETLEDLYLEPDKVARVLDMIVDFRLAQFAELHRRFGSRVHGLFLTDDWGTQEGAFIHPRMFREIFQARYHTLAQAIHGYGWHFILHSCGRINDLIPSLIEAGVDVLNMQQPRAYGITELGERFAGKVCFLTTADTQKRSVLRSRSWWPSGQRPGAG